LRIESYDILLSCPICRGSGRDPNIELGSSYEYLKGSYTSTGKIDDTKAKELSNKPCPKCGGTGIRSLSWTLKVIK